MLLGAMTAQLCGFVARFVAQVFVVFRGGQDPYALVVIGVEPRASSTNSNGSFFIAG
jgi:hypothetical protein